MSDAKNSILIVDDTASNIAALSNLLGNEYTIYAAKNGPTAVTIATNHLPDLILLDILMPEMNGYAVLAELKAAKATRDIPVIIITGLDSDQDEARGLALDAADYISKPFNGTIVKLRIRNQLKIVNALREIAVLKEKNKGRMPWL